jgi:hypothetical protein
MKRLFKKGDKVNVSGDFSSKDYNVRISSPAVVETDQKTSRSNVWVNIAEVDGDRNVTFYVKPKLLSLVKEGLPLIEGDDTTRVWVNEAAGLVVTDFFGSGSNLDSDDIKQGYTAYSMNSVYHFDQFPDETFDFSKLEDVNDGDLDYDDDSVNCYDSSMTLMHDTDEYDKKEHFEIILGMLNVTQMDGWKQVAGQFFDDD